MVEEQGQGRSSDRDAPVTFESSADDVTALLRYLKVDRADILGFSSGASVALQVAIRLPPFVRKLVFASPFSSASERKSLTYLANCHVTRVSHFYSKPIVEEP